MDCVLDPRRHHELEPLDQQILAYVSKLTKTPQAIRESDIEALRQTGCSDKAIHDICEIAAYFNFVNRMASGLGVALEDSPP